MEQKQLQRIDKLIGSQKQYTRSQIKDLIRRGRVTCNGVLVRKSEEKASISDKICIDGKELDLREHIYLMMNKPLGVVSASRDPRERTVVDLVPEPWCRRALFPAGRLDKDTTGFVLLTDDGDFAHRMLAPKKHVSKIYHATLARPYDPVYEEYFQKGVVLGDESRCLSASVSLLEDGENPVVKVILHEGMYHQVKRMFAACGNHVQALRRVQIGGLPLDESLQPGECREILDKELGAILCGICD